MKLGEWFRWFHGAINATNLAGAVDVIVIKHADGTLHASPFYVRFGKLDVINSAGKEVYIYVNGKLSALRMVLSEQGQAYFEDDATKAGEMVEEPSLVETTAEEQHSLMTRTDSLLINAEKNLMNARSSIDWLEGNMKLLAASGPTQEEGSKSGRIRHLSSGSGRRRRKYRPLASPFKEMCRYDRELMHYKTSSTTDRRDRMSTPAVPSMMGSPDAMGQKDLCFECLSQLGHGRARLKDDAGNIVRCQSDSDLERRGLSEAATFFLTRGRRAISDLGISIQQDQGSSDALPFEEDGSLSGAEGARQESLPGYVLRPSNSDNFEILTADVGHAEQYTPHEYEPFVFSITTIAQAVCY